MKKLTQEAEQLILELSKELFRKHFGYQGSAEPKKYDGPEAAKVYEKYPWLAGSYACFTEIFNKAVEEFYNTLILPLERDDENLKKWLGWVFNITCDAISKLGDAEGIDLLRSNSLIDLLGRFNFVDKIKSNESCLYSIEELKSAALVYSTAIGQFFTENKSKCPHHKNRVCVFSSTQEDFEDDVVCFLDFEMGIIQELLRPFMTETNENPASTCIELIAKNANICALECCAVQAETVKAPHLFGSPFKKTAEIILLYRLLWIVGCFFTELRTGFYSKIRSLLGDLVVMGEDNTPQLIISSYYDAVTLSKKNVVDDTFIQTMSLREQYRDQWSVFYLLADRTLQSIANDKEFDIKPANVLDSDKKEKCEIPYKHEVIFKFYKAGDFWVVGKEGQEVHIKNSMGMGYIYSLLLRPDRPHTIEQILSGNYSMLPTKAQEIYKQINADTLDDEHDLTVKGAADHYYKTTFKEKDQKIEITANKKLKEQQLVLNKEIQELMDEKELLLTTTPDADTEEIDIKISKLKKFIQYTYKKNIEEDSSFQKHRTGITKAIRRATEVVHDKAPYLKQYIGKHTIETGSTFQYIPGAGSDVKWILDPSENITD